MASSVSTTSDLMSAALLEQMKFHLATDAGKDIIKKIGLVYQLNIAPKKIGYNEEIYVVDLKNGEVTKVYHVGGGLAGITAILVSLLSFEYYGKIMKEHKNPKVLSEGLLWMVSAVEDFGVSLLKLKDLIDFCKDIGLQSSVAATRNATIKLIGALHKYKLQRNHVALIEEGKDLVSYALINDIAMRKILKKYDKIHYTKQGQAFKAQVQSMHIEILQSPWLCELMAFHINLRETKTKTKKAPAFFDGCSLIFNNGKPSLSCELFKSVKLDIDLICSICLDTVFDPVSLTCGHIFCYICACKAASVTIVDELKAADPKENCALC